MVPEQSFHVYSPTGSIDWKASFANVFETLNSNNLVHGSRIVLSQLYQDKMKDTIATQAIELMDMKNSFKTTKRPSDKSDNDEPRKKAPNQPAHPTVFDKIADGLASEPLVRNLSCFSVFGLLFQ